MRQPKASLDLFAVSLLTVLCVLLGVGQVAMKIGNEGISPFLQAGLRSAGALVLLGGWCLARGIPILLTGRQWGPGLLAALFFTLEFALLYPGLERTTAARGVTFLYTSPLFVAVGAHFLIAGDRLSATKVAGLLVALAGIAVVLSDRGGGEASLTGDILCLAAAFAWGSLTVIARGTSLATARAETIIVTYLWVSGILLVALSIAMGERGVFNPTPIVVGSLAYTIVFVVFITFATHMWLLTLYPPSKVMAFVMLTPVFGVGAGALLLGEPIGWRLGLGLVVILSGLWLVNRPAAARPAAAAGDARKAAS